MSEPTSLTSISSGYASELQKIRERFEADHDAHTVLRERSRLVDRVFGELYEQRVSSEPGGPEGLCLLAIGGYGRQELHPCSDVDVVFLCATPELESAHRNRVAAALPALWDLGLRASGGLRTLNDCRTVPESNPEFAIALLDARCLAGDRELFRRLLEEMIPAVMARERHSLIANLEELTRRRHQKYGDTIFHLEPNLKDSPGGLRDYHVARWLAAIVAFDEKGRRTAPEELWPQAFTAAARAAFSFLTAARTFVHYRRGRDDNSLTYDLQDEAARLDMGGSSGAALPATEWMRAYFRHARLVSGLVERSLHEATRTRRSLYAAFEGWRSRLSNADFSLIGGRLYLRQPAAAEDTGILLRLFEMAARHGVDLSPEAERWVAQALPGVAPRLPEDPEALRRLLSILALPHAARALRAMHQADLLSALLPEFRGIDALVTRDFYHRYTADEHTFMTIQVLHELAARRREATSAGENTSRDLPHLEQRFAELFAALERPELLFLALLLHDTGKGGRHPDHVQGSLEAAGKILARFGAAPEESQTVRFLIEHHLEMSATLLRRDVLDPATVRDFARGVGTTERLKMLTLLTYADVKAVNPEALTPWKAEALWQLYLSAANDLARSLDEERVRSAEAERAAPEIEGAFSRTKPSLKPSELQNFIEGFPRRYLAVHAPGEILDHLALARSLEQVPAQIRLRRQPSFWELTLVTHDRPLLFATVTGVLAAWGMSIVKAEAFANARGIVLDTFAFHDLHRTLDLNPPEVQRFRQFLGDALGGKLPREAIAHAVRSRLGPVATRIAVDTQVRFDDTSSAHSTLLELVTADRPGLLYDVSLVLAALGCNIEIALIDTEGQKAVDVFYLTAGGAKLTHENEEAIRTKLLELLSRPRDQRQAGTSTTPPVAP